MSKQHDTYLGNPTLKSTNVSINFTQEQIEELQKCEEDPVYFIENYVKIVNLDRGVIPFQMYPFQKKIVETVHNNRFSICKIARQSGKSTTMMCWALHQILFTPNYTIAVLANKMNTAKNLLAVLKEAFQHLPKWMQQGVVEWNKGSVVLENGSKIIVSATSSSAIRGQSANCVSGECLITVSMHGNEYTLPIKDLPLLVKDPNYTTATTNPFTIIDNKYYKWYNALIENAKKREGMSGYVENHHIIPVSLGGSNEVSNLVALTAREHYLAHRLLIKFLFGKSKAKMVYAMHLMAHGHQKNKLRITSRQYEVLRKQVSAATTLFRTGTKHTEITKNKIKVANTGKKLSKESKQLISIKNKGKLLGIKRPQEVRDKISNSLTGQKKSAEWIAKINNNPEKIRKTAEKHRGMKRSDEAKLKMSLAKKDYIPWNKGIKTK